MAGCLPSTRPTPKPVPTQTPDGRYIVVRGRLWRKSNPKLTAEQQRVLVQTLMTARRLLRGIPSDDERLEARKSVDEAKRALGERGPIWWTDGAPDYNRHLAKNTPYAAWFAGLTSTDLP